MELLAPAPFNIVCFRYRPDGVPEDALDALNLEIEERILMDGRVYVGIDALAGTVGFRPAFVNWRTTSGRRRSSFSRSYATSVRAAAARSSGALLPSA